jgi:hypothetical protein
MKFKVKPPKMGKKAAMPAAMPADGMADMSAMPMKGYKSGGSVTPRGNGVTRVSKTCKLY